MPGRGPRASGASGSGRSGGGGAAKAASSSSVRARRPPGSGPGSAGSAGSSGSAGASSLSAGRPAQTLEDRPPAGGQVIRRVAHCVHPARSPARAQGPRPMFHVELSTWGSDLPAPAAVPRGTASEQRVAWPAGRPGGGSAAGHGASSRRVCTTGEAGERGPRARPSWRQPGGRPAIRHRGGGLADHQDPAGAQQRRPALGGGGRRPEAAGDHRIGRPRGATRARRPRRGPPPPRRRAPGACTAASRNRQRLAVASRRTRVRSGRARPITRPGTPPPLPEVHDARR